MPYEQEIAREKTNDLLEWDERIDDHIQSRKYLEQQRDKMDKFVEQKSNDYTYEKIKSVKKSMEDYRKAIQTMIREEGELRKKKDLAGKEWDAILLAAKEVFKEASAVQQKTGKAKLYIGNRVHVAIFTDSVAAKKAIKKKRILDSKKWSWGLNLAWVEGGMEAEARFKFKAPNLDRGAQPNGWADLPADALEEIRNNPRMTAQEWRDLCSRHKGTVLWVSKGDEDRMSWTALEVYTLLANGYRFQILNRKHNKGEKLQLYMP